MTESSLQVDAITHGIVDEKMIPDSEGRKRIVQHVSYERSRKNREIAIKIHGTVCQVCGFDFDEVYGRDQRIATSRCITSDHSRSTRERWTLPKT